MSDMVAVTGIVAALSLLGAIVAWLIKRHDVLDSRVRSLEADTAVL